MGLDLAVQALSLSDQDTSQKLPTGGGTEVDAKPCVRACALPEHWDMDGGWGLGGAKMGVPVGGWIQDWGTPLRVLAYRGNAQSRGCGAGPVPSPLGTIEGGPVHAPAAHAACRTHVGVRPQAWA